MKAKQKKTASGSLTIGDLDKIANVLDNKMGNLASKQDLKNLKKGLVDYMQEGFEATMEGMDKLLEQMAEKEKLEKLRIWAGKVADKIGVRLEV